MNKNQENKTVNKKTSKKLLKNLEDDAEFKLHFFHNCSECLKNLIEFARNLEHFNLVDDNSTSFDNQNNKRVIDMKTTLNVSQFKQYLVKIFDESQKDLHFNYSKERETSEALKILFIKCCEYLKDEIIAKNILFPISGKYNVEYYLKQIFSYIFKPLKAMLYKININDIEKINLIFEDMVSFLDISIEELQITAVTDLCESEYVLKHFSMLLKKKIETLEDYVILEKMVVDYYNTFIYVTNCVSKIEDSSCSTFSYFPPIYVDAYEYKIVEGYEVNFESPRNFEQIKAFDNEGKEFLLEKDIDYFTDKFNRCYSTIEALKTKNVHEIEFITPNNG